MVGVRLCLGIGRAIGLCERNSDANYIPGEFMYQFELTDLKILQFSAYINIFNIVKKFNSYIFAHTSNEIKLVLFA